MERGLTPKHVYLSPLAHDLIAAILSENDGKTPRVRKIYEIMGLPVTIDEACPAGTGYVYGVENVEMVKAAKAG